MEAEWAWKGSTRAALLIICVTCGDLTWISNGDEGGDSMWISSGDEGEGREEQRMPARFLFWCLIGGTLHCFFPEKRAVLLEFQSFMHHLGDFCHI